MEGQKQMSRVPEFREILLQVQSALSPTEVQELVFLCTEMLRKDLSSVDTASSLFNLLQNCDLLSSEDSSLLLELLKIIKRDKLIRDLQLNSRQLSSHVSPYRQMLFELSENISDSELKDIKFLLQDTLPRRKLQKEVTTLQLFLEMEKEGCMGADDLSTIERLIECVCPRLRRIINLYQMNGVSVPEDVKCKDKSDNQDTSITTRPVPPEDSACATYIPDLVVPEELLPPSYFNQPPSIEMRSGLMSISGDVQDQVAQLSISENQNLAQGGTNPSFPEINQNTLSLGQYDMNGDWRGFTLIISNYDFSHSFLNNRKGTDVDEESLAAVFQWLGFETIIKQDCNKASMLSALNELRSKDHSKADCVVCCVLTHGYEGGLYGVDGEKVLLRDLIKLLDGDHCPSLRQKPKLFFIQACQGSQEQQVVFLQSDGPNDTSNMDMSIESDAQVPRHSIPVGADYLVAMATVPGYVSFREREKGTWFIQSLCKKLKQLVPSGIDLLSILTEVNKDVSSKADKTGIRKQMPQPEFTLTKRVVFPVPHIPMTSSSFT